LERKEKWNLINSLDLTVWGRNFSLPIDFDCFDDEKPYKEQIAALERIMANLEWISESKATVEAYCKDKVLEDNENKKKENIFSYVKPDYLFVKREKKNTRVSLMCKYRYDQEHGLAVVFACDGKASVGSQDIVL
jgi:hypothetical protein